ncbi:MAG: hypothetical protein Q9172_001271 [Xanthocarpia lactea]
MPVTIKPASHGANSMDSGSYVQDPLELLKRTCPEESKECRELLQSSFGPKIQSSIDASRNGFVKGAIHAYNRHYHLRIRPEDVWFAILSQLSLYINAHAEELRGLFVAHEGKKELVLEYGGTRYTVDFGLFAKEMGELIEQNVVDPELRRWMMPAFTTTTKSDIIVASILLMGSTQKYFDFTCVCLCGLPSVTLLGDRADWELILTRIEKLKEYGEEPTQFYALLKPVISRFVKSFDNPKGKDTIRFWNRIVSERSQGSGPRYYSGWITAFCFWDEHGNRIVSKHSQGSGARHYAGWTTAFYFWDKLGKSMYRTQRQSALRLDGATYHEVESNNVPPGYTSVPVKVIDNGAVFRARMVAGSVGQKHTSRQEAGSSLDTIQPESGWWMFEVDSEPK